MNYLSKGQLRKHYWGVEAFEGGPNFTICQMGASTFANLRGGGDPDFAKYYGKGYPDSANPQRGAP